MVDPGVLSSLFPDKRPLHYWAKSTLFANPIAGYILKSAGNIPVDRSSKDNAVLFKGTFEALARGDAIAVFPEGTLQRLSPPLSLSCIPRNLLYGVQNHAGQRRCFLGYP
jgi:1-acyl-sn-glycerol-3-phosphate acyltransferase